MVDDANEIPSAELLEDRVVPAELNLPWVVYEQDRSELEPKVAVRISREYLRRGLGI